MRINYRNNEEKGPLDYWLLLVHFRLFGFSLLALGLLVLALATEKFGEYD